MGKTMKTTVIILVVLSAACEIFGTVTVWRSFRKTAKSAGEIKRQLAPQTTPAGAKSEFGTYAQFMTHGNLLIEVADRLGPDPWTTAGLVAYILGALFGAIAALIAL